MALNLVDRIDDAVPIRHVLLSVSDKTGLEAWVPALLDVLPEVRLYSTGGTYQTLHTLLGEERAARHLCAVTDYTGQPEMQGGLVKTLDFKIYMGLLSETYNPSHQDDLMRVQGVAIDMVVVNLYPFQQTVAKSGVTPEQARANIDIGGPCMVRAAAKNFLRVTAVTQPSEYPGLLAELRASGGRIGLDTRWRLARQAFAHTAAYDTAIASYLGGADLASVRACYRVGP